MLNVLLSRSENVKKRLFLFKTWPLLSAQWSLATAKSRPWPHNATHPSFFYTLQKLFTDVTWPVDELWAAGQALLSMPPTIASRGPLYVYKGIYGGRLILMGIGDLGKAD